MGELDLEEIDVVEPEVIKFLLEDVVRSPNNSKISVSVLAQATGIPSPHTIKVGVGDIVWS